MRWVYNYIYSPHALTELGFCVNLDRCQRRSRNIIRRVIEGTRSVLFYSYFELTNKNTYTFVSLGGRAPPSPSAPPQSAWSYKLQLIISFSSIPF